MEKKTQRLTTELEPKQKEYAEFLLNNRAQIKKMEETIKTEKDDCNSKLMNLLTDLDINKIVGPENNATITVKISKSLDEEKLLINLFEFLSIDFGLDTKKIKSLQKQLDIVRLHDLIEKSKIEKESAPFINFSDNKRK